MHRPVFMLSEKFSKTHAVTYTKYLAPVRVNTVVARSCVMFATSANVETSLSPSLQNGPKQKRNRIQCCSSIRTILILFTMNGRRYTNSETRTLVKKWQTSTWTWQRKLGLTGYLTRTFINHIYLLGDHLPHGGI
eukprot:sb/3474769/